MEGTIHERFEAQAARTPDAVAVVHGEVSLTYDELNRRANRLAHRLRALGAGPETRAGVLVGRTAEMVVAVLGVLKAGAAYVPLDPKYPHERLGTILEDARIPLLVAEPGLERLLPEHGATVVGLRDGSAEADDETSPASGVRPENAAYLIYTSGSTGRPKAVVIEHRNAAALLDWCAEEYPPERCECVLASTSLSFDMSVFELFHTLAMGSCVVVAENALELPRLPARERVTLVNTVPSAAAELLRAGSIPASVHTLNLGGEPLKGSLARGLHRAGVRRVVNLYGPSEDTTYSTFSVVPEGEEVPAIGRPVRGTRAHLLDAELRPVAEGEAGEVYLEGAGLARGYLGRPELTAEKYLPSPFAAEPGARMYRVGDLARLRPDGELEYLGRTDHQVKVRGFRVEPGEVEAALERHPGVRDALVVGREDGAGVSYLAAYVVGAEPSVAELRAWLRERLPDYMVPTAWATLDAFPLSPNGKIDRAALPEPTAAESGSEAPRTSTEEALAAIWREVLEVDRVGIHDDFFDFGGHSLRATQVVARVREALGVELPLAALFEAPTVSRLAAVVEALAADGAGAGPPLAPVPRDRDLPLTFAQEAIWFLQQLAPGMRSYNFQATLRIRGPLEAAALERALEEIVRRHEIFRTTFPTTDGRPVQRVHPPHAVRLPPVDVDEDGIGAFLAEELARPFHLDRLPLVRWTLLRLAPAEHVLVCVEHHFVHDGWSFGVFLRELKAVYEAFLRGEPSPLPPLTVQFADYAAWQRAWIDTPEARAHLAFWAEKLAGAPPLLEVPADRPRPPALRFRGNAKRGRIPPRLAAAARAFCRERGATLYTVLLAAFEALLHRHTGATDLCVGSAVAARGRKEAEGLIGMIVNIVALRTDLSGEPGFAEVVERVRTVAREAFTRQEVPFSQVVEAVKPERALSYLPIYQVAFSFHDSPYPEPTLGPARVEVREALANGSTKFDLQVIVMPRAEQRPGASPDDVEVIWEYDTDLFDDATVDRMLRRYETLLEGALSSPETPISALPLLDDAERALLAAWNDTAVAYPPEPATLHGLVEAQAARTPDAVAVVFEGEALTYRELDRRADALAARLRGLGVGPETRVGVCMERSAELVVALLGTLKSGGAYVPLDPGYPAERLAYMLEDSAVPVLLTQERLGGRVEGYGGEVVAVDGDLIGTGAPPTPVSPDNLAYVIYTSGSTGRPKGAMNAHRGVVNRLLWMRRYGLTADDAVLQKTPFSFDVSVWEFFWPLTVGARLVMARPEGHRDPQYLSETIEREGITHLHFVPSMLQAFLEAGETERCGSVRRVMCSGEALSPETVARFRERLPGAELHNLYGPTEAAIEVTYHACVPGESTTPIGRPVPNTRIHVLDAQLQEAPVGVPGELHIGGVQVGRGYLGRPELTAEKFVPDPFSPTGGERLYRTGDRARWLATGEVEYLGRLDEQVKVRGFRIELGEIEAALLRHPSVAEAVAVAREDGAGKRLVAYVVPAEGAEPDAAELRAHLAGWVPEYMVPSAFVALPALPLSPAGKLDRRALPAPGLAAAAESERVLPRTEREELLARIWAELLRVPEVGVHDNFFEMGGDSILGIQVVARAARAGVRITPEQVFQHQTVAGLAAAAETGEGAAAEQGEVTGEVPSTPVQRWLFEQELPGLHHWNQAHLLDVREPLDLAVLAEAVDALQRHHDALRLRFVRAPGGEWRQAGAPAGGPPPVAWVDLSAVAEAERAARLEEIAGYAQASLDLAAGPLFRMACFDLGGGRRRLLFAAHHLVVDGVSWRVLLEDLATALRQLRAGEPVRLPPKTTSFREWAGRLRGHAASPALRAEADFWAGVAAAPAAPLPRDRDGANTEGRSRVVSASLTEEETRALLREVPSVYRTQVNDVLLAALARAFAAWTGERSLLVELEGHGREPVFPEVDLSRTVGWFTAIFPVWLEIDPDAGPGEAIRAVKERLRAVPGKGIGYGVLRYLSADAETAARLAARPEVSFNYHGRLDSPFGAAPEGAGPTRHPAAPRRYLLDVVGRVAGGRLEVRWHYAADVHDRATVERLAERYLDALRELIAHCREPGAGGCTPSDFPLARLDEGGLERTARALGAGPGGRDLEELYPLTPMQQGMLFHSRADRDAYFEQFIYPLTGELDAELLRRAWDRVAARHAVLRTAFAWDDLREPLQGVLRRVDVPVHEEDWRGLSPDEQADRLDGFLREDRARGFDLARAPLMRVALLRAAEDAWTMVWSHHHLLMDGWSAARVVGEVAAVHRALREGREPVLPPARPYREYVAWMRSRDAGEMEAFWRAELRGFTAPTPLALGVAPGAGAGFGEVRLRLPAELGEGVRALARAHRLTPNTVFRGAWALLLARHSGTEDVVFGATVSGRPAELPEVEERVGLFINTLPVRVRVSPDAGLAPWLGTVHDRQLAARRFEHTPLVEAQGWSEVPRGLPLFESLLVFENYPVDRALASGEGGLAVGRPRSVERPGYPLTLVVRPSEPSLGVVYDRARFGREAVERLLEQLRVLLEGMVARPESPLRELPLPAPPVRPARRDGPLPLSPEQERLRDAQRVVPAVLPLSGALDVDALRRALAELSRRHGALRTVFREREQVVLPPAPLDLRVEDAAPGAELQERMREAVRRPFRPEEEPPVRAVLFRTGPADAVLLLALHPLVCDAWSVGVLAHELKALYAGSRLPEPPVQYADYAVRQREQLADAPVPAPAGPGFRAAVHAFTLPAETRDAVAALARREGATPFDVLLAAFGLLLGEDYGAIGVPVSGRTRPELEGVVGPFEKTLPLRADLSGEPTFRALVTRAREAARGALSRQDLLAETSGPPVPRAAFSWRSAPRPVAEALGRRLLRAAGGTIEHELSLEAVESAQGISCTLEYAAERFDADTIERMAEDFRALLDAALAAPDQKVADLPSG